MGSGNINCHIDYSEDVEELLFAGALGDRFRTAVNEIVRRKKLCEEDAHRIKTVSTDRGNAHVMHSVDRVCDLTDVHSTITVTSSLCVSPLSRGTRLHHRH
ncbi:hypothetical protein ElyMa_007000300 [Elysia marginata]|uniref:Uncharacterized protein n=1 Tax=Elysia marginata TaxID=1093978 RepID=A0AAV4JQC3_9GAST|nr:hypothetical protein ElyMa_007000300 [Elysia marginata]